MVATKERSILPSNKEVIIANELHSTLEGDPKASWCYFLLFLTPSLNYI